MPSEDDQGHEDEVYNWLHQMYVKKGGPSPKLKAAYEAYKEWERAAVAPDPATWERYEALRDAYQQAGNRLWTSNKRAEPALSAAYNEARAALDDFVRKLLDKA